MAFVPLPKLVPVNKQVFKEGERKITIPAVSIVYRGKNIASLYIYIQGQRTPDNKEKLLFMVHFLAYSSMIIRRVITSSEHCIYMVLRCNI